MDGVTMFSGELSGPFSGLVVDQSPSEKSWSEWVRQLGWWHSQYMENIWKPNNNILIIGWLFILFPTEWKKRWWHMMTFLKWMESHKKKFQSTNKSGVFKSWCPPCQTKIRKSAQLSAVPLVQAGRIRAAASPRRWYWKQALSTHQNDLVG